MDKKERNKKIEEKWKVVSDNLMLQIIPCPSLFPIIQTSERSLSVSPHHSISLTFPIRLIFNTKKAQAGSLNALSVSFA